MKSRQPIEPAGGGVPEGDTSGILKYQQNRSLNQCPGFLVSAQVRSEELGPLFIALRQDALEIYTEDDRQYLYDLEGRAARFSTLNEYRFRGVSHQGTVVRKRTRGSGGAGLIRERLDPRLLAESCREAWLAAGAARRALAVNARLRWVHPDLATARQRLGEILAKVETFSPERLDQEAERFQRIYQPVPVLPPDHYASLVLQATEGCSFNTCTFCTLYSGIRFRIRSVDQFDRHIRDALAFHGEGLRRFTQIFLGQANALAAPQTRLVELIKRIRAQVELPPAGAPPGRPGWAHGHRLRFTGIGSFLDGFTGLNKSAADYAELRDLGLSRVYLGVESGSAGLLRWMQKPATPEEMLETIRRLKEAGLAIDIILLVGPGGDGGWRPHVDQTVDFLRSSLLAKGDRVFLSDIVEHAAAYRAGMQASGWNSLSPEQLDAQRAELQQGIRRLGLQPVPYRIEPFVY